MSEDGKDAISRRDFLKLGALTVAAIASKPLVDKLHLEVPPPEVLQVGDLSVHLLPFDHIEGAAGVPKAKEVFEAIKASYPDAVPMFEYFPPEIESETSFRQPKPGEKIDPQDEFGNICASYGALIDAVPIDRVLVADPAYNYKFVVPEFVPPAVAVAAPLLAFRELTKMAKTTPDKTDRRQFLINAAKGVGIAATAGLGFSTGMNSIDEIGSGTTGPNATNTPSNLPEIVSEADFRVLTAAHSLETLGKMTDTIKTKDVVLVYPQAHIDKIRAVLSKGSEDWIRTNLKFDFYKALYSELNIVNTREWTRTDTGWDKTKQIAIDYSFIGQAGK